MLLDALILLILIVVILTIGYNMRYPQQRWSEKGIDFKAFRFPRQFIWGAATAAHQVEGNCTRNDWSRWEESFDEKGRPRIKNGQKSGRAADHWHRYREDVSRLKALGCSAYRFSVEWSKLQPRLGHWDDRAIDHYVAMSAYLREQAIHPFVTLHHFTSPLWLYERGGFENSDAIRYFIDYVYKIGQALAPYVDYWATFNEPSVYADMGWIRGVFPPGKRDPGLAARVLANLMQAHGNAYEVLHEVSAQDADGDGIPCRVGLVKSVVPYDPYRRWFLPDWWATRRTDRAMNESVFNALQNGRFTFPTAPFNIYRMDDSHLKGALDWIGLNYYTRSLCRFSRNSPLTADLKSDRKLPKTDMGWAVYPLGLYRSLKRVNALGVPIFVTENGIATEDEQLRRRFILTHMDALHEALRDDVDVRGYFYWSLIDNFEWAEGFTKRFGLYRVDFDTQERELKSGAEVFREIIRSAHAE